MIRTVPIPRGVSRIGGVVLPGQTVVMSVPNMQVASPGTIGMGAGGSYTSYSFDSTGLSNDPMLAPYMQDLTPAQLQSALNGDDPTPTLSALLIDEATGTGAGYLPSGAAQTTTNAFSDVPTWAWIAGGGILAFALLKR